MSVSPVEKTKAADAPVAAPAKAKGIRPRGPQLLIDWRYVAPGDNQYIGGGKTMRNWNHAVPGTVAKVDVAHGVRLEAQAGEKLGPLFVCDKPWESAYMMYVASILFENGKYRMWYGTTPGDHAEGTATWGVDVGLLLCYAESDDGVNWRKPEVGLIEYQGSKKNNIVFGRDFNGDGYSSGAVFVDPKAPPSERYKLFYKGKAKCPDDDSFAAKIAELKARFGEGNYDNAAFTRSAKDRGIVGMYGATSPDGIHWTPLVDPLLLHYSDTLNNVTIDPITGNYITFMRMRRGGRRVVGRSETTDFRRWPLPTVVLEAPLSRHPGDDIYHGVVANYPVGSDSYLMFATFFRQLTDGRHVELASSMDGKYWNILPGQRVVEPGDVDHWTGGDTHIGQGLVSLPDGKIAVPFVGYTEAHKAPRYLGKPHGAPGLVAWEKNRLCAIVADEIGEFSTKEIVFAGTKLVLNAKTTYTGAILVELRDEEGLPIPGFTFDDADVINGNDLARTVSWKGKSDIGAFAGKTVSFGVRLRCANLYALEFV